MDNKYNVPKAEKPQTRQEHIATEIEKLVKQRDKTPNGPEKERLQKEIMSLFAQYERLKL